MIAIDSALLDENLLGACLGDARSWSRWIAVLRAAFALPLNDEDRVAFAEVAGQRDPPSHRVSELWCVVGRRSGKTRIAAAVATYIGAIEQHTLAAGEVGHVLLLAASRSQASIAFGYVLGFLESSPILRQQIEQVTVDEVRLKGNIIIGVHAGSFRTVRGKTLLAVVGDETSFWRDEASAQPDVEIYRAVIPALAASHGLFVAISTGYRRLGLLHEKWACHFGQSDDNVLVIQGATTQFNSTLDVDVIDRAKSADPEAASAEWEGGFRADIAAFLDGETIEAAIDHDRPLELPPRPGIQYRAFVDPSGGRHDSFSLCIAHQEGERLVADVIRGRAPPFDPQSVVREYADLVKSYGLHEVGGDNYSAAWVETAWRDCGVTYKRSELAKSQLYLEILPMFMRGLIRIPDHRTMLRELRLLERRASRVGKDIVDHGRNGSDDYVNALAGAAAALVKPKRQQIMTGLIDFHSGAVTWRPAGEADVRVRSWSRQPGIPASGEPREPPPPRRPFSVGARGSVAGIPRRSIALRPTLGPGGKDA